MDISAVGFDAHGDGVEVTLKKFGHPEGTKMQLVPRDGLDHDGPKAI